MRQPSDRRATRVEPTIPAQLSRPARGACVLSTADNPAQAIEIGGSGAVLSRSELRHGRAFPGAQISACEGTRRVRRGWPAATTGSVHGRLTGQLASQSQIDVDIEFDTVIVDIEFDTNVDLDVTGTTAAWRRRTARSRSHPTR